MIKIVFLGTAGYHDSETRRTVCVFLPEEGIVFDAGSGFPRIMRRIQTESLNILVSHAHLDHIQGLPSMINVFFGHPELKKVIVHGEEGHINAMREHLFAHPIFPVKLEGLFPEKFIWSFHPFTTSFMISDIQVTTVMLDHLGDATGYRLDFPNGKSLAYITDTQASPAYGQLIKKVDLLIHECNFPDSMKELARTTKHSITSEVSRIAKRAEVKKLALFHFNPLDESEDPSHQSDAALSFPGVVIARDLMEIEL